MNNLDKSARDALSAQSACNCGARPGKRHGEECQYIIDLRASMGQSTAATDNG